MGEEESDTCFKPFEPLVILDQVSDYELLTNKYQELAN
jgi:hypothetical protein